MNSGKRVGIFMALVLAGLLGLYLYKKYRIAPSIPLLEQQVIDAAGNKSDLSAYKGKALIISYYASWCGDCIKEMKELNSVKAEALPDVEVICITDEPAEKLISFQQSRGFPFAFYRIGRSFHELGIHTIPVTYLVDKKGEVVYNKVGVVKWKDDSFLAHAQKLLND
jgi:peroxiredoxin